MNCSICGADQNHIGSCPYCVKRYGEVLARATTSECHYRLRLREAPGEDIFFTCCRIDYGSEKNWVTLYGTQIEGPDLVVQVSLAEIYLVSRQMNCPAGSHQPQPPDLVAPQTRERDQLWGDHPSILLDSKAG